MKSFNSVLCFIIGALFAVAIEAICDYAINKKDLPPVFEWAKTPPDPKIGEVWRYRPKSWKHMHLKYLDHKVVAIDDGEVGYLILNPIYSTSDTSWEPFNFFKIESTKIQ